MQSYIETLALSLGISMSAIHGWRRMGRVADRHRLALVAAAQAQDGKTVTVADMDSLAKLKPGRRKGIQGTGAPAVLHAEAAEQVAAIKVKQSRAVSSHKRVSFATNGAA
jgi:hypothetical protein